tara:strand:+ start:2899 stop:3243 length:345 start_codon:yes stop_codon:yes gene_type:complete
LRFKPVVVAPFATIWRLDDHELRARATACGRQRKHILLAWHVGCTAGKQPNINDALAHSKCHQPVACVAGLVRQDCAYKAESGKPLGVMLGLRKIAIHQLKLALRAEVALRMAG